MMQKCNQSLVVLVFVVEMLAGTGIGCTSMIGGGGEEEVVEYPSSSL